MDLLEKAAANPDKLKLEGLNYNELVELKKTIDTEINFLGNSREQLSLAASKFALAKEKLEIFTPEAKDKEILVPLTTSLFVPGKLNDIDKVMFEIGASYYVEAKPPKAKDFYSRKIEEIKKNMMLLSKVVDNKNNQRQQIMLMIQDIIVKAKQDYMATQTKK